MAKKTLKTEKKAAAPKKAAAKATEKPAVKVEKKVVKESVVLPSKFVEGKTFEGQQILAQTLQVGDVYAEFRTANGNGYKLPRAEYEAL